MLEQLTGQDYFYFLNGYLGYNQILVVAKDQEKITFTCLFGTYAFRRMPFSMHNAPTTFQRCMMGIFNEMIDDCLEIFMDDLSVYGPNFEKCLHNLERVLKRCIEKDLVLN
jgi:hypothetical protein